MTKPPKPGKIMKPLPVIHSGNAKACACRLLNEGKDLPDRITR